MDALLMVFVLFLLFLWWYRWRKWKMTFLNRCGIPGPEPNLILGHLREYLRMGNIGFHSYLIKRHGSITGYYLGAVPYILVSDQELLKKIQVTDAKNFLGRPRRIPKGINPDPRRSNMLGHLPVDQWAAVRRVLSPGFSPSKIKHLFGQIYENTTILISTIDEKLQSNGSINLAELYENFSLDIISETAFGYHLGVQMDPSDHRLVRAVRAKFDHPTFNKLAEFSLCFPKIFYLVQIIRTVLQWFKNFFGLEGSYVWTVSWDAIRNRLNCPNPPDIPDELYTSQWKYQSYANCRLRCSRSPRGTPSGTYQFEKNGLLYTFPKDIHIQIAHCQIYHSDDNWPDANSFLPDRFSDRNVTKLSLTDPKWQAFGCGPRHCMGYKLALIVLKTALVCILGKYTLAPADPQNTRENPYKNTVDPKQPVLVKLVPLNLPI